MLTFDTWKYQSSNGLKRCHLEIYEQGPGRRWAVKVRTGPVGGDLTLMHHQRGLSQSDADRFLTAEVRKLLGRQYVHTGTVHAPVEQPSDSQAREQQQADALSAALASRGFALQPLQCGPTGADVAAVMF